MSGCCFPFLTVHPRVYLTHRKTFVSEKLQVPASSIDPFPHTSADPLHTPPLQVPRRHLCTVHHRWPACRRLLALSRGRPMLGGCGARAGRQPLALGRRVFRHACGGWVGGWMDGWAGVAVRVAAGWLAGCLSTSLGSSFFSAMNAGGGGGDGWWGRPDGWVTPWGPSVFAAMHACGGQVLS